MKKRTLVKSLFLFSTFFAIGSKADTITMNNPEAQRVSAKKVLIVWLSRTKNTEAVAQLIHQEVGGNLVPIELATPYPADYHQIVDQVRHENETHFLPQLKTVIPDISQYDVIFVGFPTWDMQLPPPVKSFLSGQNLSNKVVIPFNTNAGYGVGQSFNQVKQYCQDCTVLNGLQLKGGKERDGIFFVMQGQTAIHATQQIRQWLLDLSKKNEVVNQLLHDKSVD